MLAKALQKLIDEQLTTAKEIGELAGVSTSTVYRWINCESQPDFDSIRLLVRHLPRAEAQEVILSVFTAGTAWHMEAVDCDMDVNGDGAIDAEDALDACIAAVKCSADALERIRQGTGFGATHKSSSGGSGSGGIASGGGAPSRSGGASSGGGGGGGGASGGASGGGEEELTSDQTLEILALLNHIARHANITQRVLVELMEQRRKRKRLKLAR